MKKTMLLFSLTLLCNLYSLAQAAQFAVVRPNGTTYICPTWDSAYSKAVNDDYIYLPGGNYNGNNIINKKIHIIGAGFYGDSSLVTGTSNITGSLLLDLGASGGSIEGVNIGGDFRLLEGLLPINIYFIKRCKVSGGCSIQRICTNFYFVENIFVNQIIQDRGNDIFFHKNILYSYNNIFSSANLQNNIFANTIDPSISYYSVMYQSMNCNYQNNIFCTNLPFSSSNASCGNTFYNNLKVGTTQLIGCANNPSEFNTIKVDSLNKIFINYLGNPFSYSHNFHLKPTCLVALNSGTDGTDIGIYGTPTPTPIGWVPSNPHIYFKQVQQNTNSNGQLQIQFKVRTGN